MIIGNAQIKDIKIPYKLSIFIKRSDITNKTKFATVILKETVKLNKKRRDKILNKYWKLCDDDLVQEIVIKNEKLTVELSTSGHSSRFGRGGWCYVDLEISHPDLEFTFCLPMEISRLIDLFSNTGGYLTQNKFHGTFQLCRFWDYRSDDFYTYSAMQETRENLEITETIRQEAKQVFQGRGTSKWIPGHRYIIKGQDRGMVYLGKLKNIYGRCWDRLYFRIGKPFTGVLTRADYSYSNSEFLESAHVYIQDYHIQTNNNNKFTSLEECITDLVSNPNDLNYLICLRPTESLRCAIDMGPVFSPEDSGVEWGGRVRELLTEKYFAHPRRRCDLEILLGIYPDLYQSNVAIQKEVMQYEELDVKEVYRYKVGNSKEIFQTDLFQFEFLEKNPFIPRNKEEAVSELKRILDKHNLKYK